MITSLKQQLSSDLVRRYGLTGSSFVVEVGSGEGRFLQALQKQGIRVLGIETDVRTMARSWFSGVDTISAHFGIGVADYIRNRYGCANLIIARSVRAGTEEFAQLLAGAARCLTPDGIIAIQSAGINAFMEVRPDPPVRSLPRAA